MYTLFNHINRALNHSCVVLYTLMDVLVCQVTVSFYSNLALFELHFVLCKRARLVREDKLYLAKLLDKITVAAQGEISVYRICKVHLDVVVNDLSLYQLEHLDYHVQRDRDHVGVGHLVSEELDNPHFEAELASDIEVHMIFFVVLHPKN